MATKFVAQIIFLALLSSPLAAQQFYRWVDENGTMHFSETPPPNNVEATQEEVPQTALTRGPSGSSTGQAEVAEDNANAAASQTVNRTPGSTTNEEMCTKIRANIQTLTESPQIRSVDPDTGEVRMMGQEEQQRELERTRALEAQHC